ncbi:MAG: ABC-type Fe3+ transport system permease subunit [Planctomycetota bacterium]|jgi:ABC-type Fe3+ transport system permease subunit
MDIEKKAGGVTEKMNWLTAGSEEYAAKSHRPIQRFFAILCLCVLGSIVVAFAFSITLNWALSESNEGSEQAAVWAQSREANRQASFWDPLLIPASLFCAGLSCLVIVPCAFAILWKAPLLKSFGTAIGASLLVVVFFTPVITIFAWPLSVVIGVLAMFVARDIYPIPPGQLAGW